ncbi:armadillo-type protein [Pisolithus microcarpus]|nr:armadillo-type protein [Pisolithus microcarpus]
METGSTSASLSAQEIEESLDALLDRARRSQSPLPQQLFLVSGGSSYPHILPLYTPKQKNQQEEAGTESLARIFQPLIASRLSESKDSDIITGVSFLYALFQVDRQSASYIFQDDGFVDLLSTLIVSPSPPLSLAVARLFAQASGHKTCRMVFPTEVVTWLRSQSRQAGDHAIRAAGILALIKLSRGTTSDSSGPLMEMIVGNTDTRTFVNDAVEGLTYLSVAPPIKQSLADTAVLRTLFTLVQKRTKSAGLPDHATVLYGVLAITANICAYKPRLSQEERQGDEELSHPLDADIHVQTRCRTAIDSGILGVLAVAAGAESAASRVLVGRIYLSLVEDKRNRGRILQGGGVKNLSRTIKSYPSSSPDSLPSEALVPIQALAKLAITSSPIQVFGPNEGNMMDAVRPLSQLVLHPSASTLQQFEAMMALTNLASHSPVCASKVASFPNLLNRVELLLLDDHTLVRRASSELICNLIAGSDEVFARYGGKEGNDQLRTSKIQLLIAMSDVEDLPTRLAASGALAMLTGTPGACRAVFELQRERHRAFSVIGRLIDPSVQIGDAEGESEATPVKGDPGLVHRGVVCVRNILSAEKSLSHTELVEEVERAGLFMVFSKLLNGDLGSYDSTILQSAAEVAKMLADVSTRVARKWFQRDKRSRRQDDEDDPAFSTLPAGLRHSIDEAFDTCAVPRTRAFTQQNDELDAPGGFIIDSATGSDIPGDDFYIPLPSIPRTLRLLDLESDDEILGVFRNAASGWGAGNADNEGVNRKDWRAICATLLEGQEGNRARHEQEESSDEYHDDISGTAKSNQATSGSRKPSSKFPTSNSDAVHLTAEQRAICKEDFARFFSCRSRCSTGLASA